MEWLSKSEIQSHKNKQRELYFKSITLRKVCISEDDYEIHKVATKVYYMLSKIKTQNQIKYWVDNICGISTTYVKSMSKLEKVLFINVYMTFPPKVGKEV